MAEAEHTCKGVAGDEDAHANDHEGLWKAEQHSHGQADKVQDCGCLDDL